MCPASKVKLSVLIISIFSAMEPPTVLFLVSDDTAKEGQVRFALKDPLHIKEECMAEMIFYGFKTNDQISKPINVHTNIAKECCSNLESHKNVAFTIYAGDSFSYRGRGAVNFLIKPGYYTFIDFNFKSGTSSVKLSDFCLQLLIKHIRI